MQVIFNIFISVTAGLLAAYVGVGLYIHSRSCRVNVLDDPINYPLNSMVRIRRLVDKSSPAVPLRDVIDGRYDVDHIIPRSKFQPCGLRDCNCNPHRLSNLQLILAQDNRSKGAKIIRRPVTRKISKRG